MKLTQEQTNIINSKYNFILIKALAGTGKTTTLKYYAEKYFTKKTLYLVFNKDMRKISKMKFPGNTTVHTVNSFAYHYLKDFIKSKNIIDNLNSSHIMQYIADIGKLYEQNKYMAIEKANKIIDAYNIFVNSDTENLNNEYMLYAKELYNTLIQNNVIDHSGLLKYFNDNFDFSQLDYEVILVDEVQDLNPIMLSILKKINPENLVMVGDPNQSIYGFRNNINIFEMEEFKHNFKEYKLTKSFRFGKEISDKVNDFYKYYMHKDLELEYNESIDSKIVDKELIGPYCTYITRTNAHLFDIALEYALRGYNVAIPFNWEELKELLEDMVYFKLGMNTKVRNKLISQYHDFDNLKRLNKSGNDIELGYLIKIIEKYDIVILEYLKVLENRLSSPKRADITFVTAHKSKGLEFLYVSLGSDFNTKNREEFNLIYVSMTRAIKELNIKNLRSLK